MLFFTSFLASLSFMTRLGPARIYDDKTVAATIGWFPVVGLIIGTIVTLPFALGVLGGQPWVQAWLVVGGSLTLTRALHWDGWADLFDGWGSGARGERFWTIVKDSRNGAFGVLAMVMGIAGQIILLHQALAAQAYGVVVFAFIMGRTVSVCTAYTGRHLTRDGQGRLFLSGATTPMVLLVIIQTLCAALFVQPLIFLLPTALLAGLGIMEMALLARTHGGMNGDFLGAAVIWGEISTLLGWCIAMNLTRNLLPLFY